jgi:hypothetical protein
VIEVENGTKIYFAGDTNVFGDMQLIKRLYEPDVAVLPIGGHYTMDPREAAVALEFLGAKQCVPCHWGTFPRWPGHPTSCASSPMSRSSTWHRETRSRMRERWFGGTGRRVPEIAVDGELDLDGALVLDDVSDTARLEQAHAEGTPVVVRASTAAGVQAALARPEVASVVVPETKRDLARPRPDEVDIRHVLHRGRRPRRRAVGSRHTVEVPAGRLGRPLGRSRT